MIFLIAIIILCLVALPWSSAEKMSAIILIAVLFILSHGGRKQ